MEQAFATAVDTADAPRAQAPARRAENPARYDIYAVIHKALRAAMTDTLLAAGRLDAADPGEVSSVIVQVNDLLDFCQHHLEIENTYLHPMMEARRPGSTRRIVGEHVAHAAAIARLRRATAELARTPAAARAACAHALYGELAYFIGENFIHMHTEEVEHNAVLWAAYSDDELQALEGRIKAHLTPDTMTRTLRWMLPTMTPAQRAGALTAMRAAMPAPVFANVLALARAHVDAVGMRKLDAALAVR